MVFSRRLSTSNSSKSMFAPIWEEIKKPLMIRFYLILLYKLISTIQVLSLMLDISRTFFTNRIGLWNMNFIRAFTFFKSFHLEEFNEVAKAACVICFIVVWIHYILFVAVFIAAKLKIPQLNKLSKVTKHLLILHQFVLFLPIHVLTIEIINVHTKLDLSRSPVMISLAALIMAMNFFLGLLSMRCYSPLYGQKIYAKRNAELAFCDFAFKIFTSTCLVFVTVSAAIKWVTVVAVLVHTIIIYYKFHTQLPFFQIKMIDAYCYMLGSTVSMCSSIFFTAIFDEFRDIAVPDLPLGGFLLSLFITIPGQINKVRATVIRALTFEERHYKNEHDVFVHLIALRYLFKKSSRVSFKLGKMDTTNWNMALNGVLAKHNEKCALATCGCRMVLEQDETFRATGVKREKFKDLLVLLMRELYEKGVEKINQSELILLNLAQFYLLYLQNYLKSYLVLQAFEKKVQKSFETEVLIEYLKKKVQERMEQKLSGGGGGDMIDNYSSSLNLTALVQNDILFIQLKKLVHEQAVKQLRFWDMLDNYELNTKNIEASCEEVDVIRNKIERLWENLSRFNQKCSSHYLLYGLYQTLINNTVKRGERYLNDYSRMQGVNLQEKEGITDENLYDAQTVVIRISMRRDKIGMIEECSGDVESIFGYSGTELNNSNVATLMSNFFKERHHTFVMNHFERGTENVLNRQKNLYGYHKEGHIFPIFLYVSIYPNIETGLSYMGIIRNKKVYNNYILVKSDGTVDSYSPEIAEYLGLESRKRYNIVEICPEFEKINNAFNYTSANKYVLKEENEFKADSLIRKQVEVIQAKAGDSDSQRLSTDNNLKVKKEANSMNSGFEDADKATSVVEQKEESSMIKIKERLNAALRPLGKMKPVQKKLRRLNTEDIDEYKRVYDQLTISGSVLSFIPQRERAEGSIKNFLCTVADEVFDYSILRIITLGRNDENLEAGDRNKKQVGREGSIRDMSFMEKDVLMNSEQDDMGIAKVPNYEDDKLFKNPFAEGENNGEIEKEGFGAEIKGSNRSNKPNKSAILKLLKTSHENFDTQANLTGNKSGIYDMNQNLSRNVSMVSDAKTMNYSDADQDQFDTGFNDSRDFIQEMTQGDGLFHQGDSTTTGSTNITSRGGAISKFEALLYKKEEATISNKFKSYFLIIAACIVMGVISTTTTNNNLQEGSQKVQKLLSVGKRINTLLNLNYNCRILYLYRNNYITTTRHWDDKGIANYPQLAFDNLKDNAKMLPQVNVAVMNDIYSLHEISQPKFFNTKVKLNYPTTNMQDHNVDVLDTFEAVHTLTTSALEIGSANLSTLNTQSENIDYILLNSMNELYLEIQNGYKIYEEDLEETLAGTQTVTWGIAIGVVSIYGIFLVILIRDLANTHQDKIRFWNSLIKLDTLKSMGHRKLLMVFKENFENSSSHAPLKKALMEAKKQEMKEHRASKAKESQVNAFKRLKNYKLKNRSYFTIFPFLVVLAVIIVFFVLTEVLVVNQLEGKRIYMQEIKQSESYFELNLLTMNGIYEYISEGPTKELEARPIVEAIDENLAILSRLTDFSSGFQSHANFDPKAFIQMNLCDIYETAGERSECIKDGKGINVQGLLGVLTFAKESMQSAMDYARNSARAPADIVTGFQRESLIILETELKYIADGFNILSQSLAESEAKEQDSFQTLQIVTIFVFVVILLVLNYFMVWKGFKKLDGQKFDNMKILRVIPTPMILESKMLKTYLLKSFKDDLSSITNKL